MYHDSDHGEEDGPEKADQWAGLYIIKFDPGHAFYSGVADS